MPDKPITLIPVDVLPTPHDGFIDCREIGCTIDAVRLNMCFRGSIYLNCLACRNLLSHEPGRGWRIKLNSREDILRRRDEAREKHAPKIGAVWEALRKMNKAA